AASPWSCSASGGIGLPDAEGAAWRGTVKARARIWVFSGARICLFFYNWEPVYLQPDLVTVGERIK
ncbi:MAG TPA: hypothetical protein VF041_11340, partial [Gemmatimonadaceae bacterium]